MERMIRNLYEDKMVYCEKMVTFLIKVEDLRIDENGFKATARKIRLIDDGRSRQEGRITEMEKWTFGAAWNALSLSPVNDCISSYAGWRIWTDPALVNTVETLLEENKIEEVLALTLWKTE
ncbi:MAG: hypothetical protein LUG98_04720 [Tannerellaceae bacterium]|nr:hypothetical protein [Tannerellaceae bacterium]